MTAPQRDGLTIAERPPALTLTGITAGYGKNTVLRDVDLTVPSGSVTALLGPNGAGKTTLLRVAAGLLAPAAGDVRIGGRSVTRMPPYRRRRSGLCLVPEGAGIFPNLTVGENLRVQLGGRRDGKVATEQALTVFPALRRLSGRTAGSLSGGEQQMLALARCYLRPSDVVLVDEASMGLAPLIVDQVYEALDTLRSDGMALVVVEQYVDRALAIADEVHVLNRGVAVRLGHPSEVDRDQLTSHYLGGDIDKPVSGRAGV